MKDRAYAKFLKTHTNSDYWYKAFDHEMPSDIFEKLRRFTGEEYARGQIVHLLNDATPMFSRIYYLSGSLYHHSIFRATLDGCDLRFIPQRRRLNIPLPGCLLTIRAFKSNKKQHIDQIVDEVRTAVDLGYSVLLKDIGVIFHAEDEAEGLPERFEGLESAEPEVLLRML